MFPLICTYPWQTPEDESHVGCLAATEAVLGHSSLFSKVVVDGICQRSQGLPRSLLSWQGEANIWCWSLHIWMSSWTCADKLLRNAKANQLSPLLLEVAVKLSLDCLHQGHNPLLGIMVLPLIEKLSAGWHLCNQPVPDSLGAPWLQ